MSSFLTGAGLIGTISSAFDSNSALSNEVFQQGQQGIQQQAQDNAQQLQLQEEQSELNVADQQASETLSKDASDAENAIKNEQ